MTVKRILTAWLVLFPVGPLVRAQENKSGLDPDTLYLNSGEVGKIPEKGYAGIDKDTVAAYQKIGAAWVLKHPGRVPWFCFSGFLGKRKLDLTQKFPDAPVDFGLHFTEAAPMTDAGMKQLAGLKHLTFLHLTTTEVTAAGLKELAGLKKLKRLELENAKIDDATLRVLREAGLLHTLVGANCPGPQWVYSWKSDDDVRAFSLFLTKVTGAGVKELAVFKNLETLNLALTPVTGTGLKELSGLQKLRNLELSKATDKGLKGVAMLRKLTTLSIYSSKLTKTEAAITDAGLQELTALKDLSKLSLSGCPDVTGAGLQQLASLKNLSKLGLFDCPKVTDAGLAALRTAMPKRKITFER